MSLFSFSNEDIVKAALQEDLGRSGDITSQAVIPHGTKAKAVLRARESGILAGVKLAEIAFHQLCQDIDIEIHIEDGQALERDSLILTAEGPARSILAAERVALNFLCHLSGIATMTGKFVRAIEGTSAQICDTRKTTPGLRALEKYAVRCGGGTNHRFGLDDAVLIKDNHIAIAGSISEAVSRARKAVGHMVKIEVEVDTLEQLEELLSNPADIVLLDNMEPETLKQAIEMVDGAMLTEASGGVNLESVAAIAASGVDLISVGALTHSAPILDLGLDINA